MSRIIDLTIDPAAITWQNAVVAAGGTAIARDLTLVSNFVKSMKTAALWNSLDNWWFHGLSNCSTAGGQIAGLIDVKSLRVATQIAAPTWTNGKGPLMNGTSQYLNLGTVGGDAGQYALNSAMFGTYSLVNYAAGNFADMGASNVGTPYCSNITLNFTGPVLDQACNDGNGAAGQAPPADIRNMWVVSRTSSAGATIYNSTGAIYNGGNQVSTAVPTINFCVGASLDNTSTATLFTPNQYAMSYIGGGLTAGQITSMILIANTFMKGQGTNVF